MSFNPNDIGKANGNYFALPYTEKEAKLILISVPWDATTSYIAGTAKGPKSIIDASVQVDLFDFEVDDVWKTPIAQVSLNIEKLNIETREKAVLVIEHLEKGGKLTDENIQDALYKVNKASQEVNNMVYTEAKQNFSNNKLVGVVGGEHSVPFGLIKASAEKHGKIGVLQIDAHADLRNTYEGFVNSHASIMYNTVHKIEGVSKLVQVGIRDLCEDEMQIINSNEKIVMFSDQELKEANFRGITWEHSCNNIVRELPKNVHISFDIDGLDSSLCPNTGTPVPGGLSFPEASYLLWQVVKSGRRIVSFDLCETAPGEDEWDANVAARILLKLCSYAYFSFQQN